MVLRFSSAGGALTAALMMSKIGAFEAAKVIGPRMADGPNESRSKRLFSLVQGQYKATEAAVKLETPTLKGRDALAVYIQSSNPMWKAATLAYEPLLNRVGNKVPPRFVHPAVVFSHAALALGHAGHSDLDASSDSFVAMIRALEGMFGEGVADDTAMAVLAGRKIPKRSYGLYFAVSAAHLGSALMVLGGDVLAHSGNLRVNEEGRIDLAFEFLLEAGRLRDAYLQAIR